MIHRPQEDYPASEIALEACADYLPRIVSGKRRLCLTFFVHHKTVRSFFKEVSQ